jgi:hypothetical protein
MSGVIKINNSNEKILKDFSTFKGTGKVKVLAINPTLAELQALGMNFNAEPEYVGTTDSGEAKVRIDFIIGNEKLKTKMSFFLEDRVRKNNSGDKSEFINNFGQSSWGTSVEEVTSRVGKNGNTWFKEEGAREAIVGEVALVQFLKDWLNTGVDDPVYIQRIADLFKGNVAELKYYVKAAPNNEVYVLFTVRENDGKFYQNVYNGSFVRASFTPQAAISKFAAEVKRQEDSGYPIKGFAGLEFGEYVPQIDTATPDTDTPTTAANVDNLF